MDTKKFGLFTELGHAVTGDRTRRSRRVGWEYCHPIVDDCSRLAYSELHDDECADIVTAFTQRALDFFLSGLLGHRRLGEPGIAQDAPSSVRLKTTFGSAHQTSANADRAVRAVNNGHSARLGPHRW